jgi:sigma-B regulation protein RsbU (phosphoserine phosphatase)
VERHLSPGDIVLGFTDGVYEVMNNDDEMFGLERLKQLLEKTARMIPRDIIERVIRETDKFRGSRKRPDDVCMVAAEMH